MIGPITTRQIGRKWHAYCGCGGYWSSECDTEAAAIKFVEWSIANGQCQCPVPRESKG